MQFVESKLSCCAAMYMHGTGYDMVMVSPVASIFIAMFAIYEDLLQSKTGEIASYLVVMKFIVPTEKLHS